MANKDLNKISAQVSTPVKMFLDHISYNLPKIVVEKIHHIRACSVSYSISNVLNFRREKMYERVLYKWTDLKIQKL